MTAKSSYSIADLADAGGVSRRTVRFYVQRELLPPPEGLGRGARYTDEHLARLLRIKGWQEQGVPLEEISARLQAGETKRRPAGHPGGPGSHPGPGPDGGDVVWRLESRSDTPGTGWFRQPLVAGFELHVGAGRRPLSARQLAMLARTLGEIVNNGGEKE